MDASGKANVSPIEHAITDLPCPPSRSALPNEAAAVAPGWVRNRCEHASCHGFHCAASGMAQIVANVNSFSYSVPSV